METTRTNNDTCKKTDENVFFKEIEISMIYMLVFPIFPDVKYTLKVKIYLID